MASYAETPQQPTKSLLPGTWDCPAIFRQRLGEQAGRQRLMQAEGHLLLVLHAPPEANTAERSGRFFWRGADGNWASSHHGSGPKALMKLLTEYEQQIEQADVRENAASTARDYFELLTATTPLHRSIANMHAVLQEARTACREDRQLIVARDKAYESTRRAELLAGDVKHGLDYAMARRAEQQALSSEHMAQSAHRLNVLAAFFFPIAALTAIFGVNLRTGWEDAYAPWPFLLVLGCGLLMGLILSQLIIVKPRT